MLNNLYQITQILYTKIWCTLLTYLIMYWFLKKEVHQTHIYTYWASFIRNQRPTPQTLTYTLTATQAWTVVKGSYSNLCNSNHYDEYMKLHIRYAFANKCSTKNSLSYNNMKFKLILSLGTLIMINLHEIVFKLIFTRRTSPSYLYIWNIVFLNIL